MLIDTHSVRHCAYAIVMCVCVCTRRLALTVYAPINMHELIHLITFWKFHRLTGVNWKFFGTVPVLGTFLRNVETPFGGAVHKADETHKVLRSAFPFMVCDFQFLSNSHHMCDQNTRSCCAGVGSPRRRCSLLSGSIYAVNWKGTGNHIP